MRLLTASENGDLPMHWIRKDSSEKLVKCSLEQLIMSAKVNNKDGTLSTHVGLNK